MKNIFLVSSILLLFTSCLLFESKPEAVDGNLQIKLKLTIPSDVDSTVGVPVAGLPVKISTSNYNIPEMYDTTDADGNVQFDHLPFAYYTVEAYTILRPDGFTEIEVVGAKVLELVADSLDGEVVYEDSLSMESSKRGLKINEIYTSGPPNNIFYFFDQYFELYNGLSTTTYLDGMIFLRLSKTELFADTLAVTNIYQFPGTPITGRQYPIEPGAFVILAGKAMNHNLIGPIAGKTVDLSNADWEFFNMIEAGAYDNPNVPNITTNNGKVVQKSRVDFMVGLTGDGLALCDGTDYDQTDGIDIRTVIDCVEYSSSETHTKEVPYSLDVSFGGIGQSKYNSESLERIRPGFDTNNSRVDFVIISKPTPGYHHE
jgi:hypothetical protein